MEEVQVEPKFVTPEVTVVINGQAIDISYACEFDHEKGLITLPDNLPGGSEVYCDGVHLITTAVDLTEKPKMVQGMRKGVRPMRMNILAACIGAALYGDGHVGA